MGKFKKMMNSSFLLERMDYLETAKQLVKKYNLRSKVKITSGKNSGEYVPETDTITLRPSYSSTKEFYKSILHEIQHAKDAYRLGVKKFMKKYTQAGTMAAYDGLDPHDDNKWEERAERFARSEVGKYI
jgi:antirestriction protein ArdC